jgi:hypothetical protein
VGVKIPLYRPVHLSSFAIEWQLFPVIQPAMFHLVNVLLYRSLVSYLFLLLQRLMIGWNLLFPFLCALLYAAHPIHTEVVNNIKGADELLCFCLAIVASLSALRYAKHGSAWSLIFMVIFYFISILSKETGIVFLVGIPMMLFFFTDAKPKKILTVFALWLGTLIPYFLLRAYALRLVPAYETSPLGQWIVCHNRFYQSTGYGFCYLFKV